MIEYLIAEKTLELFFVLLVYGSEITTCSYYTVNGIGGGGSKLIIHGAQQISDLVIIGVDKFF